MSIWIHEKSKVLIQGITGKQGTFHGTKMDEYNTNVVGGVTPGKGGQFVELPSKKVPVFNTVEEAEYTLPKLSDVSYGFALKVKDGELISPVL